MIPGMRPLIPRNPTMPPIRRPLALGLTLWVALAPALTGCSSTMVQDKRILQYLNQEGFGKRYQGNAQEQNYVTIGDTITWDETLSAATRTKVAWPGLAARSCNEVSG